MPIDKSLFFYGSPYHRLLDPALADVRRAAVGLVSERSSVIDVACGTGQLCFELHGKKHCRVVGVDLSLRMLDFARAANRFPEVSFRHLDATDLDDVADDTFDWATIVLLVHELPLEKRVCVVKEAFRVARAVLIIDAAAPLPRTPEGLLIRFVEHTFGRDHRRHFDDFLARGGITALLRESGHSASVVCQLRCAHDCREAVVITRRAGMHPQAGDENDSVASTGRATA